MYLTYFWVLYNIFSGVSNILKMEKTQFVDNPFSESIVFN